MEEPLSGEPWFQWIERAIIEPKCLRCHQGTSAAMGVDLSSYEAILRVVVPYHPEQSRFFTTIESGSMPKGGERLTDTEISRIYDWIQKGASNGVAPSASPTPTATPEPSPSPQPLFSWINRNIFVPKCLKCHKPPKPAGDVDFSSFTRLIDSEGITKKPIEAENPEESGVYDQVVRQKMPPGPDKLTRAEELAIFDWIKNGANEN